MLSRLSPGESCGLHGDELGRSQGGNNNVYCQDNEVAWVDWDLDEHEHALLGFTSAVARLRAEHPVFRRRRFFQGKPIRKGDELRDIAWFTPSGEEMKEQNWDDDFGRSIAVFLNGDAIADRDARGERVVDDSFLLAFNAHHEDITFTVPDGDYASTWAVVVDTATGTVNEPGDELVEGGGTLDVVARSLVVLQRVES